jgi:hypothetical protein
MYYILAYIFAV